MSSSQKIVSIQQQFIWIALILGSFIIIASSIAYIDGITSSNQLVKQVEKTTQLQHKLANIRNHYQDAKNSLDAFMLEPESSKHQVSIKEDLAQALFHIEQLKTEPIISGLPSAIILDKIIRETQLFDAQSEKLFQIRINANEQYPALGVATSVMRPSRNQIFTIFSLMIDEFIETDELSSQSEVFQTLVEAQRLWISTIAEFRLYLANRIGSFAEQGLLIQENNIEDYFHQLENIVQQIQQFSSDSKLGFESSIIITNLPGYMQIWKSGFMQIKKIHHSDAWRKDSQMMRTVILPLLNDINLQLSELDLDLGEANTKNIELLNQSGNKLSLVLAVVILLFLFYITVSIISLKRLIIKPIALIANALKKEAFGKISLNKLNIRKTRETQDLIKAFNEMSHQVYKRQKALEHQALNDNLTSLPNRLMLQERLQYHLKLAHREKLPLVLMILDLNHFKEVNDTLGHHVGDQLLIKVGKRLKSIIRDMDTVARLGGDEFAILLPQADRSSVEELAMRINKGIATPFMVHNHSLNIGVSIGIAEHPTDSDDMNTLMQYADVAMYQAKRNKSGFSFYDATADRHSIDRLSLVSDLRAAIKENQLMLYYQPKYRLADGVIIGAEALLRWDHPVLGFISPEMIIDTAEKMGLINELSYWIIENAIAECAQCSKKFIEFDVSINLSVQNLRDESLSFKVNEILQKHKLPARKISFEITESAMMTNPEQSIGMLNLLNSMGVKLAIDDFGTGFSSLAYLKQMPVDELKIDKSFVIEMDQDKSDQMIVNSTINLAHNLGISVVAEGVENIEIWEMLRNMQCDQAQGYLMSKPLKAEMFRKYLTKNKLFNNGIN